MLARPAANQAVRICICEKPIPSPIPAHAGQCLRCVSKIESLTTDDTVAKFFDRLGESLFPYDPFGELVSSDAWESFREHCERRELAGRDTFGNRFMSRDSILEAEEEAADLALYLLLDNLRHELEEGEDRDVDLVMTVAMFAFKGYEALLRLKAKRAGAP
jgi:hypothetical protein